MARGVQSPAPVSDMLSFTNRCLPKGRILTRPAKVRESEPLAQVTILSLSAACVTAVLGAPKCSGFSQPLGAAEEVGSQRQWWHLLVRCF